jgi:hypothetical protein
VENGVIGWRNHLCGLWYSLPRGGKTNRFVGTALEPYVAVAFCVGIGLSFILMLSGVIALMEGR